MVWGLIPVASPPGAQAYYIFTKGRYKVGRKDCDIIIQTDRAISRLHAEIIVDAMSEDPLHDGSANDSANTYVRVKDHSKFGTFINKEQGNNAIHSCPNKEATLKDGDVISFGTGFASFRFSFINFVIYTHCSNNFVADVSLQATISSIGARVAQQWSHECTHALVEDSSTVTTDLLNALIARKPVVSGTWIKVLAEKGIRTEIPDCFLYSPSMTLNGAFVKVVESQDREKCLEGHTFILKPTNLYKFGDTLASLIEAVGGNITNSDVFTVNSQTSVAGGKNQLVLVKPMGSGPEFVRSSLLNSLVRVDEAELVRSIISGKFELPKFDPPSIIVSSSYSTDETVVADSDVENDTVTSNHPCPIAKFENTMETENENTFRHANQMRDVSANYSSAKPKNSSSRIQDDNLIQRKSEGEVNANVSTEKTFWNSTVQGAGLVQRKHEGDDLGASTHQNTDIIYSQNLIARNVPASFRFVSGENVVDFKCFKKSHILPGNTFRDLIPFSKEPYNDSDFKSNDAVACAREEKKRKQMEAISEDLFNNIKRKKGGSNSAGGSLLAFLARS